MMGRDLSEESNLRCAMVAGTPSQGNRDIRFPVDDVLEFCIKCTLVPLVLYYVGGRPGLKLFIQTHVITGTKQKLM